MQTIGTNGAEFVKRAKEAIEKRTGKTTEELYEERDKRVRDATELKEPDRVPVLPGTSAIYNFVANTAGLPKSTTFYDPVKLREAYINTLVDYDLDFDGRPGIRSYLTHSGQALETLQDREVQWPGGSLPPNYSHHFIDVEPMKANEYDLFITDPTDFIIRFFLPRVYGALDALPNLPVLGLELLQSGLIDMSPKLTKPEIYRMAKTLAKAGDEEGKWRQTLNTLEKEMGELGYPPQYYPGGVGGAPIDVLASRLRGMRGFFSDMFKQPEKVLAACESILNWRVARAKPADPKDEGYPRRVQCGGPHYGSDEFMTRKQFETFCWPTWKKGLVATIDMGFIPNPGFEGKCDERSDYFLELPKGKFSFSFREVDIHRMKSTLGGHCCLIGGVPAPLLACGSPQEVEEYCKTLIKVLGKGGGYIMACLAGIEEAKPENVKAMIDSAKKYGRY